jgi:hypothetical protein
MVPDPTILAALRRLSPAAASPWTSVPSPLRPSGLYLTKKSGHVQSPAQPFGYPGPAKKTKLLELYVKDHWPLKILVL